MATGGNSNSTESESDSPIASAQVKLEDPAPASNGAAEDAAAATDRSQTLDLNAAAEEDAQQLDNQPSADSDAEMDESEAVSGENHLDGSDQEEEDDDEVPAVIVPTARRPPHVSIMTASRQRSAISALSSPPRKPNGRRLTITSGDDSLASEVSDGDDEDDEDDDDDDESDHEDSPAKDLLADSEQHWQTPRCRRIGDSASNESRRAEALQELTSIEMEFAKLRERLYAERLRQVQIEEDYLEAGQHVEYEKHAGELAATYNSQIEKLDFAHKVWLEQRQNLHDRWAHTLNYTFLVQRQELRSRLTEQHQKKLWRLRDLRMQEDRRIVEKTQRQNMAARAMAGLTAVQIQALNANPALAAQHQLQQLQILEQRQLERSRRALANVAAQRCMVRKRKQPLAAAGIDPDEMDADYAAMNLPVLPREQKRLRRILFVPAPHGDWRGKAGAQQARPKPKRLRWHWTPGHSPMQHRPLQQPAYVQTNNMMLPAMQRPQQQPLPQHQHQQQHQHQHQPQQQQHPTPGITAAVRPKLHHFAPTTTLPPRINHAPTTVPPPPINAAPARRPAAPGGSSAAPARNLAAPQPAAPSAAPAAPAGLPPS
ncbi:hypothetical protein DL89DRAFT_269856 [Linderina pennispora]|uniref:Uncharacterized protein n=1 Tax=Linderina pennispora TaxID=61395 RepID=A0A1Y1W102_9FUNG|nr:uncharacterized protein DL89DRAFT_269856 [Linderina pennispora]ORX66804.1 hypothetical protein DL89DRAFT_269856 [Linderina pennispora]